MAHTRNVYKFQNKADADKFAEYHQTNKVLT
jgi:hypothetical protein